MIQTDEDEEGEPVPLTRLLALARPEVPILAVATLLIVFSVAMMTVLELLRRRNERMRGIQPS